MDLEREKGITIKSKNASVRWKDTLINIVDTPGHADFGGEVERILNMVDGVLLLVDAADGPQAQTRFVLKKAIEQRLALLVMINKIDREQANPDRVHGQVLDLLLELNAAEHQFNAPFLYGSAKNGYAMLELNQQVTDMAALFESIVEHVPAPRVKHDEPFHMLVSNLDWDNFVGRIAIGKIISGRVSTGERIACIHKDGSRERGKVSKIYTFSGLGTSTYDCAHAGDIVNIAGFDSVQIGDTLADPEQGHALPFVDIDPPTLQMQLCVNDGPLSGRDGKYVTARQIRDRLIRETRTNVSLEVEDTASGNVFTVKARGELQIAVVAETMRREGFELLLSRPEVIYRTKDAKTQEPFEDLWLEIPSNCLGDILQNLATRQAQIGHLEHVGNVVKLEAVIPTRGLIGLESFLLNRSGGEAVMSHIFKTYSDLAGEIRTRTTGVLISMESGKATGYALDSLQERGKLFIGTQDEVYPGMVIGENARADDLPCNPTRTKQLTNVRASGSDKAIQLQPPTRLSLEKAIEFIAPDEYVEVTPNHLRLRKKVLDASQRRRLAKSVASRGV